MNEQERGITGARLGGVDFLYVTHVDIVPFSQHQHGVALARIKATTEYAGPVGGLASEGVREGYCTLHLYVEAEHAPKPGSVIRMELAFERVEYHDEGDGLTSRTVRWGGSVPTGPSLGERTT